MILRHIFILCLCFGLTQCSKDPKPNYFAQIAVDAFIEEGGYAYVFLTSTTEFESVIDSSRYFDYVLTHAKISISTDDENEVLILKKEKNYFPQHFYRSNYLVGKTGKTYRLEITLNGDTLTATTTIPQKVILQLLTFNSDVSDTTKGLIMVGFNDPKGEHNYYRAFTKIYRKQFQYYATHLSVVDDSPFNGQYIEFPLYQGLMTNTDKKIDFRYSKGDTIDIKFCTIDKTGYEFWSGYEREMLNAGNPFGAEGQNLKSNINGGIGVFTGYGVSKYRIVAK